MLLKKNKTVTLIYELRINEENGELIEKIDRKKPLIFSFGDGEMLEKFEEKLEYKKIGYKFNFKIDVKNAYGRATTKYILDVPKDEFKNNEGEIEENLFEIGNVISMFDNEKNLIKGVVISEEKDLITLDFNHPLAGEDLYFKGEILNIE